MHISAHTLDAFVEELEKLAAEKDAGLGDTLTVAAKGAKKALTTPIPGTRPWFLGRPDAVRAQRGLGAGASSAAGRVLRPGASATKRVSGGAYDVSDLARSMGL